MLSECQCVKELATAFNADLAVDEMVIGFFLF